MKRTKKVSETSFTYTPNTTTTHNSEDTGVLMSSSLSIFYDPTTILLGSLKLFLHHTPFSSAQQQRQKLSTSNICSYSTTVALLSWTWYNATFSWQYTKYSVFVVPTHKYIFVTLVREPSPVGIGSCEARCNCLYRCFLSSALPAHNCLFLAIHIYFFIILFPIQFNGEISWRRE